MNALRILNLGCRLVLVLSLFVLAACSDDTPSSGTDAGDGDAGYVPPDRQSRTFTSQADWESGSMSGLNPDATGSLQMNAGLALFETPYMWVPNSTDRTVSKIDTKTMEVLGTFDLIDRNGEWCYNPSRTTVDIQGNVWVGCRGNASYLHRASVTAGMVPVTVDNKIMKISGQSGAIMLSLRVGHAPRSLSLDANNHLWVGCSVDDTVWEVDGDTGVCYRGEDASCLSPVIAIEDFPYGSVVDQRGHLWIVQKRRDGLDDLLTEIDTQSGLILGVYGPYDRAGCTDLYGIAVDQLNNIWLGGFACDDLVKVKGTDGVNPADGLAYATGELIGAYMVGGSVSRGVAVDLDGNVWVASSTTATISKIKGSDGELLATIGVGAGPIGVGIDAWGNGWAVSQGANSVTRINGLDMSDTYEIAVGLGPYSYSDMLGLSLRTITHQNDGFAWWLGHVDSGMESPTWLSINWVANAPDGTRVEARFRCHENEEELATAPWGESLTEPGAISCPTGGRYGQVEIRMYASGTARSPVLESVTLYWE